MTTICPCDTGLSYEHCCKPYHEKKAYPKHPLDLMRSRYAAFALKQFEYVLSTQSNQSDDERDALITSQQHIAWVRLDIIDYNDSEVEFIATMLDQGQRHAIHERSRFERHNNQWIYINGEAEAVTPPSLPKRNEPCWCGSKQKFKRCHG